MSDSQLPAGATVVDVDGIGVFVFANHDMRAEIAISVEYARLSEGVDLGGFIAVFVRAIAELKALTLDAPQGFRSDQLDDLDPFDDDIYARVLAVWNAMLAARASDATVAAASPKAHRHD
jgi:hypothetical protein